MLDILENSISHVRSTIAAARFSVPAALSVFAKIRPRPHLAVFTVAKAAHNKRKSKQACRAGVRNAVCLISVCHLLRSGVAAIFGPQSAHTASHVQSICDTMEIPHLETRWDYRLRRQSCLVNLYPHPTTLSKVRRNLQNNSFIKASSTAENRLSCSVGFLFSVLPA